MHLGIIGATGNIGSHILAEALARGHRVVAIARSPAKIPAAPNLTVQQGDTSDPAGLAPLLHGQDAVLVSVKYTDNDINQLIDAIRRAGLRRCLFVVGAGSLLRADGRTHYDHMAERGVTPPSSKAAMQALDVLRGTDDLDWTAISPAADIGPGPRTGSFRVGLDHLIADDQGVSRITRADFAIAILDEIEDPKHIKARFTVAY
jgi:putative NADH-flavin reductase